ncbi:MAG TPA: hypothetical protein VFA59_11590, partial [Vicinamibacterales bacterium]|nr:hypothetical protein [Vicinamibacterales bacterium]
MIHSYVRRGLVLTVGVLAIAGAATAMRLDRWAPVESFLERGRAVFGHPDDRNNSSVPLGLTAATGRRDVAAYNPAAEPRTGYVTGTAGKLTDGRSVDHGFAPDSLQGAMATGSDADVSLSSLWRLMGLARHHEATPSTRTGTAPSHSAGAPRTPAPPKPPHAPHASPHPPTSTTTPTPTTTTTPLPHAPATVVASVITHAPTTTTTTSPAILIGSNPPSVSGLIGGGSTTSTGGSFGSGGGGTVGTGGTGGTT